MARRNALYKHPRRDYFHKRRLPPRLLDEKIMRMHHFRPSRGRECCAGWDADGNGDLTVIEAQRNGKVVEIRVLRRGYIAAVLRGAAARRWELAEYPQYFFDA